MTFNVLVAEPADETWSMIAEGIRQHRPDATILRVKDGEQAVRFLFYRGLFTEAPETPNLVVLAGNLPTVPSEVVVARLREHPRTFTIPVVVVGKRNTDRTRAFEYRRWVERQQLLAAVDQLQSEVADAVRRLCDTPMPLELDGRKAVQAL